MFLIFRVYFIQGHGILLVLLFSFSCAVSMFCKFTKGKMCAINCHYITNCSKIYFADPELFKAKL